MKHKSLTIFFLLFCLSYLQAQKSRSDTSRIQLQTQKRFFLKVVNTDSASTKGFKMPDYDKVFASSKERLQGIHKLVATLNDESYLTATVDSMLLDSNRLIAFLNPGKPYKWAYLRKGNVDEAALSLSGFREKIFQDKPLYFKTASKLMNSILAYYENHG